MAALFRVDYSEPRLQNALFEQQSRNQTSKILYRILVKDIYNAHSLGILFL